MKINILGIILAGMLLGITGGILTGCGDTHTSRVQAIDTPVATIQQTLPSRIKLIETYKYVLDNPRERNDNFTRFTVIKDTETNVSYLITQADDRIVVTRLDGKQ